MTQYLITQVINYGTPLLALIVFIGGLGVPLPCTPLVIAAGAFAKQNILPWPSTAIISIISVVIGDSISYSMGYYFRERVITRFSATPRWLRAEQSFQKWGPLSIFFSRFLVTPIALPVNLLSGTTGLPFRVFLTYDLLGEIIWILGYGGLGYFFSSNWEPISNFISNFGGLLVVVIILIIGIRQIRNWQLKKQQLAK